MNPVGTTKTTTPTNSNSGTERRTTSVGVIISLISVALAFLVQFGASMWWGATLSSDVRHAITTLEKIELASYTKAEATRDIQRLDQQDLVLNGRITEIIQRIHTLETRMDTAAKK